MLGEHGGSGLSGPGYQLIQGDARYIPLPTGSVHQIITSPPYYSLRDYGLPPTIWDDKPGCIHTWEPAGILKKRGAPIPTSLAVEQGPARVKKASQGEFCSQCGAWRGVLGLEPTVDLYIQHMVEIMRECRRVLRHDGTCWLNIGDSYNGYPGGGGGKGTPYHPADNPQIAKGAGLRVKSRHPLDRLLVPHRLAIALQDDGWIVRADIIWAKGVSYQPSWAGSVMPESVRNRPTCAHEHVLLLAKEAGYYYDYESAREPGRVAAGTKAAKGSGTREGNRRPPKYVCYDGMRNPRDVWAINTKPFSQAHFATFPPGLIEPIIRAGCPSRVCPICQTPWAHLVERSHVPQEISEALEAARVRTGEVTGRSDGHTSYKPSKNYQREILGERWEPRCECVCPKVLQLGDHDPTAVPGQNHQHPVPTGGIVLDPFCGSGTVGVVALEAGVRFIGLDASAEYLQTIAGPRLQGVAGAERRGGPSAQSIADLIPHPGYGFGV